MFPIVLLAASLAAPGVKEKGKPEYYFPITVGAKTVWQSTSFVGEKTEITETVTKVEEKAGVYSVTTETDSGGTSFKTLYRVSATGVVSIPGGKDSKPMAFVKLPVKEGETWTVDTAAPPGMEGTVPVTFTTGAVEEIEVQGVKYKALKVTNTTKVGRMPQTTECWYAPGIGEVKSVTTIGEKKMLQEMKSFTPGK